MIKKLFIFLAFVTALIAPVRAADVALIYTSSESITAAHSWPVLVTPQGAVMPADVAMASANSLLYGDGNGLFRASIARLDNDVNLAVVRPGERVGNEAFQAAHAGRWRAALALLNISTASVPTLTRAASAEEAFVPTPGAPAFAVKVNGVEETDKPVVLKERFKKSHFKLEVVNTSTAPVWNVQVTVKANPQLAFWKEGRRSDLNDVPEKVFSYTYQTVFKPMKPGSSFNVPVEVFFIKERDYVWDIRVTSKSVSAEKKVLVRFE